MVPFQNVKWRWVLNEQMFIKTDQSFLVTFFTRRPTSWIKAHRSNEKSGCWSSTALFLWRQYDLTCDILIPHERVITLVFWYQEGLAEDVPIHVKFLLKLTHPFPKCRLWQIFSYNVSTIRLAKKSWIIANKKSTTGFPTSYGYISSAYVTPQFSKGCFVGLIVF